MKTTKNNIRSIKEFCKSDEWGDFLDKVMDLVEEKYLKEGEVFVNMLPHDTGITVSIASEPIHITQKHVYLNQDVVDYLYTQTLVEFEKVHKIRTVHIWWGELENRTIR